MQEFSGIKHNNKSLFRLSFDLPLIFELETSMIIWRVSSNLFSCYEKELRHYRFKPGRCWKLGEIRNPLKVGVIEYLL